MTKEELKKEAEEWLNKWELCNKCDHKAECIEEHSYCHLVVNRAYVASAEPREKRIADLEQRIEKMKSQYDYAFIQLCESREIICLMLSQYKNKKEIDYSTRERGEKLLKQGVYKYD